MSHVDPNSLPPKQTYLQVLSEFAPELLTIGPSLSNDDANKLISESAKLLVEFTENEKADQELKELKEKLKDAKAQYTEGKKVNRAKIEYLRALLISRGAE